jgi:hypothetical protein
MARAIRKASLRFQSVKRELWRRYGGKARLIGIMKPRVIRASFANAADPDLASRITKHRPGVLGVTEVTHTHGGSVELAPPVIQITLHDKI